MHKSNIVLMVQRSQMLVLRVDCINHVMIRHLPRHQYTKKDYLSQHNLMLLTQSIWLLDVARKVFLLQKIRCKFLQDQTGISKVIAQNLSMASRTSHTQFKYSFQNLKQIVETGIDQPDFPCCFIKIFGFNSRVYKEQCVLFCYRRRRRSAAACHRLSQIDAAVAAIRSWVISFIRVLSPPFLERQNILRAAVEPQNQSNQ